MKFGWEASAPMQAVRNNKLWLAVPALALVAFGLWKFGLQKDAPKAAPAPTPVAAMPAPAAAAMPAPAKPVEMPVVPGRRTGVCGSRCGSYARAGARGRDRRSSEEERRAESSSSSNRR